MKKINISYPQILVGSATVGLVASFLAAWERVEQLKDPGKELACSINPIVDCGGVLNASQSSVFGPPNTFIAMVVFSVLLGLGIQLLTGGTWTKFTQKMVLTLSGILFVFSAWFFYVSLYELGKICLFCVFIWPASVLIAVYSKKYYLEQQKNHKGLYKTAHNYLQKNHYALVFMIFALMITLYLLRFRDYYFG